MKKLLLLPLLLLFGLAAGAQCVASFTWALIPYASSPLHVQFNNTSTYGTIPAGSYIQTHLNYGDGSTITFGFAATYPQHTYSTPGTYTVGMRISKIDSLTNTVSCTDSVTHVITIAYSPCISNVSIANNGGGSRTFTANNYAGTPGMTYSWDFGDGGTGTGSPITHVYAASGSYIVMMTATGGGCSFLDSFGLAIQAFNSTLNCANLHANFSSSVNVNNVAFTNSSSTVAAPYFASSNWYFGDGSSASFATNPTHTYAATGTYNVQLITVWHDSLYTNYCSDTVTHPVTISSVPPPPSYIAGNILWDSTGVGPFDSLKVYLIQFNSATNILSAVDSMVAAGYGGGFGLGVNYQFNNPAAGNYLVKAASLTAQPGVTGNVPTYHDSSLYWNTAQTIVYTGGSNTGNSIWMKHGTQTSGPGFISGNVSLGANKGAQNGVPGLNVYLLNSAGKAIKNAVTDANGNFSLYSIPAGTYSIYPEHLNYATTPVNSVIVSNSFPTVSGINFNQDNAQMNIKPHGLSVIDVASVPSLQIVPNPASKLVNISWNGIDAKGAHLIITNIAGSIIEDKTVTGNNAQQLDVSSLQPGLYFVRGTDALSGTTKKLVIE